jgi:hypothetical protein
LFFEGSEIDETLSMANLGEFRVGIFKQVWKALTCDLVNINVQKCTSLSGYNIYMNFAQWSDFILYCTKVTLTNMADFSKISHYKQI